MDRGWAVSALSVAAAGAALYGAMSRTGKRPLHGAVPDASGISTEPKREQKKKKVYKQFYRRPLPLVDGAVIPFASERGKKLFSDALIAGTMECFFELSQQFRTQAEPAFCGISTLTMVLNALSIDPGRLWKGPWRWYVEEMLDCCKDLETVKVEGIDFDEWACLARCNGLCVLPKRAEKNTVEDLRAAVLASARKNKDKKSGGGVQNFVVVSYTRKGLSQSGGGHFSPIAGYNADTDMCLLLDVARFKYPPHWIKLPLLFSAMKPCDSATGKSRGFYVVSADPNPSQLLFRFKTSGGKQIGALRRALQRMCNALRREVRGRSATNSSTSVVGLVKKCVEAADEAENGPAMTALLEVFSAELESATQRFQKYDIEVVPREHRAKIRELVDAIEATELFADVQDALFQMGTCTGIPDHCPSNTCGEFTLGRAHLATTLLFAVAPFIEEMLASEASNDAKQSETDVATFERLRSVLVPLDMPEVLAKEVAGLGRACRGMWEMRSCKKCVH